MSRPTRKTRSAPTASSGVVTATTTTSTDPAGPTLSLGEPMVDLAPVSSLERSSFAVSDDARPTVGTFAALPSHDVDERPHKKPRLAPSQDDATVKLNAFLKHHAAFFAPPLLPERNYISTNCTTSHRPMVPYRPVAQPKAIAGGEQVLKDYQLAGLSFLAHMHENGANCILADEMGLGKTLQTISLFAYLEEHHGIKGPHLVICPLSVLSSWMGELARWLPTSTVIRLHGPMQERERIKQVMRIQHFDILVTTYEAFQAEQAALKHFAAIKGRWSYLVLDEGHRIKNRASIISTSLQGVGAQHRLILTGTPLQNNLGELWALLHWLYPQIWTDATQLPFTNAFNLARGNVDPRFLAASQRLLELIMLRRTKEGVKGELTVPPRKEMTLYVPLSPFQRFWYSRILTKTDTNTLREVFKNAPNANGDMQSIQQTVQRTMDETKKGTSTWQKLQNLLLQLRKICNHPYLITDAEPDPYTIDEHIVLASSKLMLLDKLLAKIIAADGRALIFSGFTRMLDVIQNHMVLRGIGFARLDGQTSRPRRSLDIKLFQQKDSPYRVFLISTRAGGLGINLTAATDVIVMDLDWNPQATLQAIARAHRIGQERIVNVYKIIVQDSVEDQMARRIAKKLYLASRVMGVADGGNMVNHAAATATASALATPALSSSGSTSSSKAPSPAPAAPTPEDEVVSVNVHELLDILRGGSAALAAKWSGSGESAYDAFAKADIDELLARSQQIEGRRGAKLEADVGETAAIVPAAELTPEDRRRLVQEAEDEEQRLLQGIERVETRLFEGERHTAPKSNAAIAAEWDATVKRARQERTVMIDGHAVSAETLGCRAWEAVQTITSNEAALAKLRSVGKQTRKIAAHQDYCVACRDGGECYECRSCPRLICIKCCSLSRAEARTRIHIVCPQHNCTECERTTAQAGGMLFRCQTCAWAGCEDCLPDDGFHAIGENLPEFELLGFRPVAQAYYIRCHECVAHFELNPDDLQRWEKEEAATRRALEAKLAAEV